MRTHCSPGNSWGFGALLKGTSVVVLRVERALYIHPPTYYSCRTETRTRNLFDYERLIIRLTIRSRLFKCVVKDQMTFRQCNDGDQRSAGGKVNPEPSLHALILTCHNQFTVWSVVEYPPTPSHKPATHATLHRNPHGFKFYFHTASTTIVS